jgi:polysaccharide pyruvyl transferase WcaK-like protein
MAVNIINAWDLSNIGDQAILMALYGLINDKEIFMDFKHFHNYDFAEKLAIHNNYSDQSPVNISVGGDIFNNSRPYFITRRFLFNLHKLMLSPKSTFIFGQTIPSSCQFISYQLLKSCMQKISSVTVRDEISYKRLKSSGINVELSFDTAFALQGDLLYDKECDVHFTNLCAGKKSLVLSIRYFDGIYRFDNQTYIHKIANFLKKFSKKNYKIFIIIQSQENHSKNSDYAIAEKIKEINTEVEIIDLFNYKKPLIMTTTILALADVVIATRYHTAIFRLLAKKMPYLIYYSEKGSDLNKRLNIKGTHIENIDSIEPQEVIDFCQESFNPDPLSRHVKESFAFAYSKARGIS